MSDQDSRDSRALVPPAEILDEPAPDREIPEKDPETGEVVGFRKLKSLSLREHMFVQEYLKDFDVAKVAERMVMSPRKVHGFLQRKHVKAEVMKRAESQFKANDMDTTWVMANIREVVERCMDEDRFDPSNALRGLELVGKRLSLFTDKVEVNNKTVIRIESNVGDILNGVIDITPKIPKIESKG